MQRRAAAMYVIFFVLIAVGSFAVVNVAEAPDPAMDQSDHQLTVDDSVTIDGTTYNLTRIDVFSATFEWTQPEAEQTGTITNESTIESDGVEYLLEIDAGDEPDGVTLIEQYPEHDLETVEIDGVTYVVIEENNDTRIVPEEEYLADEHGPRERLELTVGDSLVWDDANASVTIDDISSASVTVSWVGPMERSITVQSGQPTEIGQTTYVANFVGTEYIQLTTDVEAYETHRDEIDTFDERYQGFWGITVLSLLTAILIGGLSFLPQRR